MTVHKLEEKIREIFFDVFRREISSEQVPELVETTILLETGLDSLGFAVLVLELEEALGFDPFSSSPNPFYPQTFGEFVEFYEQNKPA